MKKYLDFEQYPRSWGLLMAIVIGALMAGCATPAAPTVAASAPIDPRTAYAAALGDCATAIKDVVASASGNDVAKVVAVGAIERLCGAGGAQLQAMNVQTSAPQPSLGATLWTAALQVADVAMRGYGIKANRDVAIVQSNNAANTTIASYGAFQGMGQQIQLAGTAGYPYVQAPAANITTTLSGTGVIGSGQYTGPVTTTTTTTTNPQRNCTTTAAGVTTCTP